MNLAIDIGNSCTHLGLFDGKKTIKVLTFDSGLGINTIDEKVKTSLGKYLIKINKIGISSVSPSSVSWWNDAAMILFKISPVTINYLTRLPLTIKIRTAQSLGTDRICNAVFAYEHFKHKENVIIADFGTANTYDVVLKNGDFIGGIIAPGVRTSARALNSDTGQLPLINTENMNTKAPVVGKNTQEAIQSGLLNYPVFATEGIIKAIEKEYKRKFKVIITGGSAKKIAKKLTCKTYYVENAVLEGINMILNFNSDK